MTTRSPWGALLRCWMPALLALVVMDGCGDDDEETGPAQGTGGVDAGSDAKNDTSTGGTDAASDATSDLSEDATDASTDSEPDADEDVAPTAACQNCHSTIATRLSAGAHKALPEGCVGCHKNGFDHQANPASVKASIEFTIHGCAGTCHQEYETSYLKDDGIKAGSYGGSVKTSKYLEFPAYKHLMGGHGFTLEYNEDRAHAFMLKDHREIARKQNVVCLQCKSTPIAYYFNEQRRGEYPFSTAMTWDNAVKSITDNWGATLDYGASCNHCHDPHGATFRLVRKAQLEAILERGTDPYGATNFYPKTSAELFAKMNEKGTDGKLTPEARRLAGTLTCAQCHVEYTCGPGIDKDKGILRDDFPWRKLRDIEDYYKVKYNTVQDWKHSGTGLPGIKAQHPETEFFWESKHYASGVACIDCHAAKTATGTSHFFSSPFKDPQGHCGKCHAGDYAQRVTTVKGWQDQVWNQAKTVETSLDQVLTKIEALASDPNFDGQKLLEAKQLYMRALLWWEFTIVSENSTGAHNPAEAKTNLDTATTDLGKAKTLLGL
ncbi:MAG: ammonia-forming cytochrome c nitrite reductase subunit c552 [Polyangiaceae bacterium]